MDFNTYVQMDRKINASSYRYRCDKCGDVMGYKGTCHLCKNKNGKVKVKIPCPDGIEGCAVAHSKWVDISKVHWTEAYRSYHSAGDENVSLYWKMNLNFVQVAVVNWIGEIIRHKYVTTKNNKS